MKLLKYSLKWLFVIGLELNEELIHDISQEGLVWMNPQWKNYDGTIAEW